MDSREREERYRERGDRDRHRDYRDSRDRWEGEVERRVFGLILLGTVEREGGGTAGRDGECCQILRLEIVLLWKDKNKKIE